MRIWMKKPPSWKSELWREGLAVGNGLTSGLLLGTVGTDRLLVNRFDRWENVPDSTLPDVSYTLQKAREYIQDGDYPAANDLLLDALTNAGYEPKQSSPKEPLTISFAFHHNKGFSHYRRGINLDTGEAFCEYDIGENHLKKTVFASRHQDELVMHLTSTLPVTFEILLPETDELACVCKSFGDGTLEKRGNTLFAVNTTDILLRTKFGELANETSCYDALLACHKPLFETAMGKTTLSLGCGEPNHANELLLDEAFEDKASPELYQKLWAFGRYLFVSGTSENGYPFPLYGLWNGEAEPLWSGHVANENVQMIYWHCATGGYANLMKSLIHYFYRKMPYQQEAAKKLFGCNGIYVSTYTTPINHYPAPMAAVILNCVGVAGWLANQFFEYYRYTHDDALLQSEILPFMTEAAAFYEDYLLYDADGHIEIVPSVSPENSPAQFVPENFDENTMAHPCPVVKNATIDFGIIKELLTNLISVTPAEEARAETWKHILQAIPDYMVTQDGAVKEWQAEELLERNYHRHLSHIYPLFPGKEIHAGSPLFDAFRKAVDTRELGAMSGWAFAHMACIYARLHEAENALSMLNDLAKSCLLPNFFTLHNDWRCSGLTLDFPPCPVQFDALMGTVNAVQEMLLFASDDRVELLPACPAEWSKGEFRAFHIPGGTVDLDWNKQNGDLTVKITALWDLSFTLYFPDWCKRSPQKIKLAKGEVWGDTVAV